MQWQQQQPSPYSTDISIDAEQTKEQKNNLRTTRQQQELNESSNDSDDEISSENSENNTDDASDLNADSDFPSTISVTEFGMRYELPLNRASTIAYFCFDLETTVFPLLHDCILEIGANPNPIWLRNLSCKKLLQDTKNYMPKI